MSTRNEATRAISNWFGDDDRAYAASKDLLRCSRNIQAFAFMLSEHVRNRADEAPIVDAATVDWNDIASSFAISMGREIDPKTGGLSKYYTRNPA